MVPLALLVPLVTRVKVAPAALLVPPEPVVPQETEASLVPLALLALLDPL